MSEPTSAIHVPEQVAMRSIGWWGWDHYLTAEQVALLLADLHSARVAHMDNGQSHVEAWDIRAMLTRVFGFARWDEESIQPTHLIFEEQTQTNAGREAWRVAYQAHRRLNIRSADGWDLCHFDASATGEWLMPSRGDAHDNAVKTAESQALKRMAINLGTQFGLSLYRDGQIEDVVRLTLVRPPVIEGTLAAPPDDLPGAAETPTDTPPGALSDA